MGYRIGICDDSKTDTEYISSLVAGWAKDRKWAVDIRTFLSGEAFLFQYQEEKDYDMLLLDVEMEHMDGVSLAKRIREENDRVQIIFITGYSDYIAEGYEVSALQYLLKPVSAEKLAVTLDRAVKKLQKNERVLLLDLSEETVRIPLCEIRYLEVYQNYVTIYAEREYRVKKPLKEFEKKLDEGFFRIGRSAIVNLAWIRRATKTQVFLADGSKLFLPRRMYDRLNRAIIDYT